MQDFDKAREERAAEDRSFKIGGETFVLRSGVRPEIIAAYDSIQEDSKASDVIQAFDRLVLDLIVEDDDAAARWTALRERTEDPVTLDDLGELVKWAMEMMTSRPTQASSPSPRGREPTGTKSTAGSSPRAVRVA